MPHVELPTGIRIRYDERGPRDARPLVLAHGFSVGLEMWFPQMHVLSQDYRLITWDARGHGGSSAPDDVETYTMPALAEDLRGLLQELDAVDGAIIGGMSFGGQIAMQYAVPARRIVRRSSRAPRRIRRTRWGGPHWGSSRRSTARAARAPPRRAVHNHSGSR